MARIGAPTGSFSVCPRISRNVVVRPSSAVAAVAPSATTSFGFTQLQLADQPGAAGGDFARARFLVEAFLAARLEFEMLDGIGHEDFLALDFQPLERCGEHAAGGTDEGAALYVFLVARLLANEHEVGRPAVPRRARPEWRSGRDRKRCRS